MKNTSAAALNNAISKLKAAGVIKRDTEVATGLNYSKSTLSEYINSKKPISYAFSKKFEEKYKLDLSNFEPTNLNEIKEKNKKNSIEVAGPLPDIVAQLLEIVQGQKSTLKVVLLKLAEIEAKQTGASYSSVYSDLKKVIVEQHEHDISGDQKLFS